MDGSRTSSTGTAYAGQALGAFVAASSFEALPEGLRHQAKRAVLNYLACALGSADDPAVDTPIQVMAPFSGPERVTLVGRRERLDLMGAAFVNAIAGNLLDFDDTHWRTAIHPTAPVLAPVLALAEQQQRSGADLLHALILGVEVECRIGNAVSPGHYARGWHITSTCGVFGAAAACARLLGLDADQTWTALGIAASQSAGVVENLTTAAKNVSVGNAARNGLLSALMARAGYTAAPAAIEGPLGWARAMGDAPAMEDITGELGQRWEFLDNAYKPYPCGFVFHAVIDACIALRERLGPAVAEIAEVVVRGDQLLLDRGGRAVRTPRDARVSIAHAAAIGLSRGRAVAEDFDAAAVADPALQALRAKVRAELAPGLPTGAAAVRVTLRDGRNEAVEVLHPRGSPQNPLPDAALEVKLRQAAPAFADRIAAVWSLDEAPTAASFIRSLAAP